MAHMRVKSMFFNKAAVMRAADRATRQVLSRFGAFVRTAAQTSIRRRKAVSKPGQPPSSHVGHLRRLIFFAYAAAHRTVVIGPLPFGRSDAPYLLEQEHVPGTVRRVVRVDARRRRRRMRVMVYRARPFMGPAFEREKAKLPALWAGALNR